MTTRDIPGILFTPDGIARTTGGPAWSDWLAGRRWSWDHDSLSTLRTDVFGSARLVVSTVRALEEADSRAAFEYVAPKQFVTNPTVHDYRRYHRTERWQKHKDNEEQHGYQA